MGKTWGRVNMPRLWYSMNNKYIQLSSNWFPMNFCHIAQELKHFWTSSNEENEHPIAEIIYQRTYMNYVWRQGGREHFFQKSRGGSREEELIRSWDCQKMLYIFCPKVVFSCLKLPPKNFFKILKGEANWPFFIWGGTEIGQ